MDDVTGIGDEKVLRQYNQWREVCRWDVEPTKGREDATVYGLPVIEDASVPSGEITLGPNPFWTMRSRWVQMVEAFNNMAAAFEELAGEHRELWEAFMRDAEALSTPCPGDPEDYTFVRAYYRPRRSKLAAIEPDHPTVQAAPGEGQSGASGEATAASMDCPECDLLFASLDEYGDHYRAHHSEHP